MYQMLYFILFGFASSTSFGTFLYSLKLIFFSNFSTYKFSTQKLLLDKTNFKSLAQNTEQWTLSVHVISV